MLLLFIESAGATSCERGSSTVKITDVLMRFGPVLGLVLTGENHEGPTQFDGGLELLLQEIKF